MTSEQVNKWERIFDVDLTAIAEAVDRDARIQRAGAVESVKPSKKTSAAPKPKSRTRRLDEQTRTKRGQPNRKAKAADRDPPKPVLPRTMLDEAEQMVRDFEVSRIQSRGRPKRD